MHIFKSLVKSSSFVFFLLFCITEGQAQTSTLQGKLLSAENAEPMTGATVILTNLSDTTLRLGTMADLEGNFTFKILLQGEYNLRVTFLAHLPIDTTIAVRPGSQHLGTIYMHPDARALEEISIMADVVPQRQRGDTTEYHADAFKTNPDANAEDLVSKMPGITVEGGRVQAQGEDVRRVLVDGQEFFGEDATLALRNLPAEMIERVQVYDRPSDQARFTGVNDGNEERTLNIVTRQGMRSGQFGKVYAGYGTDNRYIAGGSTNIFQGQRRISIIGLSNNINQQNFDTEDLLGVVAPQSGGRGGRGGGRGRGGQGTGDFMIGPRPGISHINSIGLNYTDKLGEKFNVTGSYFFNRSVNSNNTLLNREYYLEEIESRFYTENRTSESTNMNHRFNMRIEYNIDDRNSLIFTPRLSFQDNNAQSFFEGSTVEDNVLLNETNTSRMSENMGFSLNNSLLYRHRFSKERRTLSLNLSHGMNNRDGNSSNESFSWFESDPDSILLIDQFAESYSLRNTYSANLVYTEPLSQRSTLQFAYRPSYTVSESERETFNITEEGILVQDTFLTNIYENIHATHRSGVTYMFNDSLWNFSAGMDYQYANLNGDQYLPYQEQVRQSFQNVLPNFQFRYRFSRTTNLNIFYRTRTSEPSITQLQNVLDNSNPLQLSTGNPGLGQSYSHKVIARFGHTNPETSRSMFSFVQFNTTSDYIGNSVIVAANDTVTGEGIEILRGAQLSRPQNLDGHLNVRSFFVYSMPVSQIKSNINFNAGASYSKIPSEYNGQTRFSNQTRLSSGLVLSSNISENLDFRISYSAAYNIVNNDFRPNLNNNFFTQNSGAKVTWLFGKGFLFSTETTHILYAGIGDDFNTDYLLWNAGFGYKFLKNNAAEIRLSVFDILNNNDSVVRELGENYVEDSASMVLNRYAMLTFTYTFRNFQAGRGR